MHVVARVPKRSIVSGKRMYSPTERLIVRDGGLGEVDGINLGKMFTRLVTFKSSSFKPMNIMGAIGSLATTTATMGLAPILAPKLVSAHSTTMKQVGMGVTAAAAVVGAGFAVSAMMPAATGAALTTAGTTAGSSGMMAAGSGVLAPAAQSSFFAAPSVISTGSTLMPAGAGVLAPASGGFLSTAGSVLSTIGSGIMTGVKAIGSILPMAGQLVGGGGGGQQQVMQQEGQVQADPYADYYAQQYVQQQAAQQAAYDAQTQMYQPASYEGPFAQPYTMNSAYGDLRSPYTAITEDGQQIQIDPATGQVIQPGIPTEVMIGIGAAAIAFGVYMFMSSDDKVVT